MKKFNKLTCVERHSIFDYLKSNKTFYEIAHLLGRSVSTISREVKKNLVNGKYDWEQSNTKARNSITIKSIDYLKYEEFNKQFIEIFDPKSSGLKTTWKIIIDKNPNIKHLSISQIYNLINQNKWIITKNQLLKPKYVKGGKENSYQIKRNTYGVYNINIRRSIINKKLRIGDYEVDLINGTLGSEKGHLFVMIERKTRKIWIRFIQKKNPRLVCEIITQIVKEYNLPIYSITCDNGLEFRTLSSLRKVFPQIEIYYCNPYASRERGIIENANGIIRRFFPKGTDFTKVKPEKILEVETTINNMRREILYWKTANEIFEEEMNKLIIDKK